jgi:hypothetical protein
LGGVFLLGILTKRANSPGVLIGIAVSIVVQILVAIHEPVHLIAYAATGVVSCFFILYDLKLELINNDDIVIDEVKSYFGMRKIAIENYNGQRYFFLNNKPLFHFGVLDQGWWPDGLYTPPSDEAMRYDIEVAKQMGFNMIRKHIKVESDRWFYHCDKLGMLVWQDMPSAMVSHPGSKGETIRLQHVGKNDEDLHVSSEMAQQFEWEFRRIIDQHFNTPSVVMWVNFNEGWGQYETCRIAAAIKNYDTTRLVNAVSGWVHRSCGEIFDIHSYKQEILLPENYSDKVTVLGEYGGIGYPVINNLWDPKKKNWGYQTYFTEEELLKNYKYKYRQILKLKENEGLGGAVYTQITDVEGEVNGLITYDREVIKIPTDTLNKIHSGVIIINNKNE